MSTYLKSIQAYAINYVDVTNIQVIPSLVKIGNTFIVNATLTNNSTIPIFFHNMGSCDPPFSLIFDNHVIVTIKKINCVTMISMKKLNPGQQAIVYSPTDDPVYNAVKAGTVRGNLTLSYEIGNQFNSSASNIEKIISKPFSFMIYDNNATSTNLASAPEFPFTIPILLVGFASLIVFYRIKFR